MARPYVKWSDEITAWRTCRAWCAARPRPRWRHPTGPVFLSLPVDVLNAERELDLGAPTRVAPRIAAIARRSRRPPSSRAGGAPVLMAGDAVARGDALAEMAELAELLGAPVYTEGVRLHVLVPVHASALPRRPSRAWRRRSARS